MRNSTIQKIKEILKDDGYLIKKIDGLTYHFYLEDLPKANDPYPIVMILSAYGRGCNDILSEEEFHLFDKYCKRKNFNYEYTITFDELEKWLRNNF